MIPRLVFYLVAGCVFLAVLRQDLKLTQIRYWGVIHTRRSKKVIGECLGLKPGPNREYSYAEIDIQSINKSAMLMISEEQAEKLSAERSGSVVELNLYKVNGANYVLLHEESEKPNHVIPSAVREKELQTRCNSVRSIGFALMVVSLLVSISSPVCACAVNLIGLALCLLNVPFDGQEGWDSICQMKKRQVSATEEPQDDLPDGYALWSEAEKYVYHLKQKYDESTEVPQPVEEQEKGMEASSEPVEEDCFDIPLLPVENEEPTPVMSTAAEAPNSSMADKPSEEVPQVDDKEEIHGEDAAIPLVDSAKEPETVFVDETDEPQQISFDMTDFISISVDDSQSGTGSTQEGSETTDAQEVQKSDGVNDEHQSEVNKPKKRKSKTNAFDRSFQNSKTGRKT